MGEVATSDSRLLEISRGAGSNIVCTSSRLDVGGAEGGIEIGLLARERGSSSE